MANKGCHQHAELGDTYHGTVRCGRAIRISRSPDFARWRTDTSNRSTTPFSTRRLNYRDVTLTVTGLWACPAFVQFLAMFCPPPPAGPPPRRVALVMFSRARHTLSREPSIDAETPARPRRDAPAAQRGNHHRHSSNRHQPAILRTTGFAADSRTPRSERLKSDPSRRPWQGGPSSRRPSGPSGVARRSVAAPGRAALHRGGEKLRRRARGKVGRRPWQGGPSSRRG
jgi:hypothetical protein